MKYLVLIILVSVTRYSVGQNKPVGFNCSAKLEKDVLTLENDKILRTYKWNNGNIVTLSLTGKESGKVWQLNSKMHYLALPGETDIAEKRHKRLPNQRLIKRCY